MQNLEEIAGVEGLGTCPSDDLYHAVTLII